MTGIVTRTANKVTVLEVEVFFFANATKLWMLRIEFLESCTKGVFVPATNDYLVTWSRAEHHLLEALVPYEVGQDAEGVHAHAVDSGSFGVPELVTIVVNVFSDHFVHFAGIAKLQSDLSVLVFPQIAVDLVGEVDHLLADLNTNEHVEVIDNF